MGRYVYPYTRQRNESKGMHDKLNTIKGKIKYLLDKEWDVITEIDKCYLKDVAEKIDEMLIRYK